MHIYCTRARIFILRTRSCVRVYVCLCVFVSFCCCGRVWARVRLCGAPRCVILLCALCWHMHTLEQHSVWRVHESFGWKPGCRFIARPIMYIQVHAKAQVHGYLMKTSFGDRTVSKTHFQEPSKRYMWISCSQTIFQEWTADTNTRRHLGQVLGSLQEIEGNTPNRCWMILKQWRINISLVPIRPRCSFHDHGKFVSVFLLPGVMKIMRLCSHKDLCLALLDIVNGLLVFT